MEKKRFFVFTIVEKFPILFLILFSGALLLPLLGSYPLLGQWETHYGRVAMEMLAQNRFDWFLDPIYLGKNDFWSKPIFCFWMVLPFYKLMGPTELATRLPFAINGIFTVVLVYWVVARMFNDKARGIVSGMILTTIPMFYLVTKQFMWDITTLFFVFGTISFLYLGVRDNSKKLIRLGYVFAGLCMLTKGLLSLILPAGVFFLWMFATIDFSSLKEGGLKKGLLSFFNHLWHFLKSYRVCEGLAIFLLVSAWWYIYMTAQHGLPFLKEFFIEHHFGRMEGIIQKPDGTFEFYVWQIAIGAFPWSGLFIPALFFVGTNKEHKKEESFIALSFFFMFLFFTLSGTKFPHYIFPAIPFLAIIVSLPVIRFFEGKSTVLYPLTAAVGALIIAVTAKDLGTGMNYRELLYMITTHRVQDWFGRVYDMVPYLRILVPPMILFLLLPLIFLKSKVLMKTSIVGYFISVLVFSAFINYYWVPKILWVFSPKKIVEKYFEIKQPGDVIVDYDDWKDRCMYFYLGLKENMLKESNLERVKTIITEHPSNTVYVVIKKDKVPALRALLMSDLQVPLTKIMDDKVDTYMEIELYKTSLLDKGKGDAEWKKNLLTEADLPSSMKKIGSTFSGGMIEIVGYEINNSRFNPGEQYKLTVYYRALKPIPESYRIFFHFDVYDGALPNSHKFDEFPQKGFYPTQQWKVGEIVKETFEGNISKGHPGGGVKIYTGFFKGGTRMPVDENKYNDGENRFILGTFYVNIK